MKFTPDIKLISFDYAGYKTEFDLRMTEITKDAARSWLRTVLVIIPTWSRASRATFEALANEVGFNITYGPQRSREDRLILGLSTGRGGLDIAKLKKYTFFYETDLRYLAYNEMNNAIPGPPPQPFGRLLNPTPYNFREAGKNDFMSFARNIRLPSPIDFITPKQI
jgi:hypothetical protein